MEAVRLAPGRTCRVLGGILPEARAACLEQLAAGRNDFATIVFLPHLRPAEALAGEIEMLARVVAERRHPAEVLLFPPPPEEEEAAGGEQERLLDRAAVFSRLRERREQSAEGRGPLVILTTAEAFFAPAPAPHQLDARSLVLRPGDAVGLESLVTRLQEELGYDAEAVCEYPGQFAVRGGLLDVYPPNAEAPVRIDFFGDEIDAIRRFDPTTQRSDEALARLSMSPRRETPREEAGPAGRFVDYLEGPVHWIWLEGESQVAETPAYFHRYERIADKRPHFGRVFARENGAGDVFADVGTLAQRPGFFPPEATIEEWPAEAFEELRRGLSTGLGMDRAARAQALRQEFFRTLRGRHEAGEHVCLLVHNDGEAERLRALIAEEGGTPA
ncbi:MAG: hypothetical protein ACLFU2_11065, partial [Opitutales bacterium]